MQANDVGQWEHFVAVSDRGCFLQPCSLDLKGHMDYDMGNQEHSVSLSIREHDQNHGYQQA